MKKGDVYLIEDGVVVNLSYGDSNDTYIWWPSPRQVRRCPQSANLLLGLKM